MNIIIAGDFCPQNRVASIIDKKDYSLIFSNIKEIVEKSDYSLVNFECPVITGDATPISKCGRNLSCSSNGVDAIKWAGFRGVTLANNHFFDYGKEGVEQTISTLNSHNLDYVGGGVNINEASKVLYKKLAGHTLAIINCCEHEFSIATENTPGSNPLNPIQQYYKIQEARKNADYILVIVHGGHEHYQLPSPRMKELYRFFIDAGANAVVNHHQHCYSGYEIYNECPIFYGLGNFCFDSKGKVNTIWNDGFILSLTFSKNSTPKFEMFPYIQCSDNPSVTLLKNEKHEEFLKNIQHLSEIISDDKKLQNNHEKMMEKYIKNYELVLQPYNSRLTRGLYKRGLLPSFLEKNKINRIKDVIICESHFDRLLYAINHMK